LISALEARGKTVWQLETEQTEMSYPDNQLNVLAGEQAEVNQIAIDAIENLP
jgi:hypothetical protein